MIFKIKILIHEHPQVRADFLPWHEILAQKKPGTAKVGEPLKARKGLRNAFCYRKISKKEAFLNFVLGKVSQITKLTY